MTGCIKLKNGYYYAIINYKDKYGTYKQKWFATGLKERGNKKLAKEFLETQMNNFKEDDFTENKTIEEKKPKDIIFIDYLNDYIEGKQKNISPSTYRGYKHLQKVLYKYFGNQLKLKDISYKKLLDFYDYLKCERNLKNNSIKKYKEILAPALNIAYRDNLIERNPYDFMPKLKREKSKREYYDQNELENLFRITDSTIIGLIVRVAAYYGFRRSEIAGLRWQSIDFKRKTITVENKVLNIEKEVICTETLKTLSSNRTMPLLPEIEERLIKRKKEIEHNKKIYKSSYNKKYEDYVFVNDIGDLILPDYISHFFGDLLKKHNLKHIRFHDLRHSCASLLVANKVPMKHIQEWLGHSSYNLTADTYSHLSFESKKESANVISKVLSNDKSNNELENEIIELERLLKVKKQELEKTK